eukprot:scaffold61125_cov41-Tisochrysis_lutea.AAC.3
MAIAIPPSTTFCGGLESISPLGGWKYVKMNAPYTWTSAPNVKKASLTLRLEESVPIALRRERRERMIDDQPM